MQAYVRGQRVRVLRDFGNGTSAVQTVGQSRSLLFTVPTVEVEYRPRRDDYRYPNVTGQASA